MDFISFSALSADPTRPLASKASGVQRQPPPKSTPTYLQLLSVSPDIETQLPSHWNPKDKGSHLTLSHHQRRVIYSGPGKNDGDAAAVRANHSLPNGVGFFYFEVEIVSQGRDGFIAVGCCGAAVSLQRLPGWEPHSWGYHGDDGHSFNCSGTGKPYGPTFSTGDIIGCGVDLMRRDVFYTKNGIHLGTAFKSLPAHIALFPAIGLRTPGEEVEVNFGQKPFRYDIQSHVREEQASLLRRIQTSLDDSHSLADLQTAPLSIVLEYLLDQGYTQTAQAFGQQLYSSSESSETLQQRLDVSRRRQRVCQSILQGHIQEALELIHSAFPQVISSQHPIHLDLHCQHFLELINRSLITPSRSEMEEEFGPLQEALLYGQQVQDMYRHNDQTHVQRQLVETFSVLAYPDPRQSPVRYLLEQERRVQLADRVNRVLLESCGHRVPSVLEDVCRHVVATVQELQNEGDPSGAFVDPYRLFLRKD